jgi:hypothetical protein
MVICHFDLWVARPSRSDGRGVPIAASLTAITSVASNHRDVFNRQP